MSKLKVGLVGITGRMGQRVQRLLATSPNAELSIALVRGQANPAIGSVPTTQSPTEFFGQAQAVIDFSAPAACGSLLKVAMQAKVPCLIASTSLTPADTMAIQTAASVIPIFQAANLSLGIHVMGYLVEQAAGGLKQFDIEIAEIHHRHKKDAPSGTALTLGEAAQRGQQTKNFVAARAGHGAVRGDSEIGYAVMRGGEVAGEHTVYFLGDAERLEITHRSYNADVFASGAIMAIQWLVDQSAGLYGMRDMLGASHA